MHTKKWLARIVALAVLVIGARPGFAGLADPLGDTFNQEGVQHDIISIAAGSGSTGVLITVTFANPIAPPSAFDPNRSVVGYIDLDLDQNPATGGMGPWGQNLAGGNSWINFFVNPPNPGTPSIPGPLMALGDELYIDLRTEALPGNAGFVNVQSAADNSVLAKLPITFAGSSLSLELPFALMGGDGLFNYGVLVGNFRALTDRAPNGATPAIVAEPRSALLLALGALAACTWRLSRVARPESSKDVVAAVGTSHAPSRTQGVPHRYFHASRKNRTQFAYMMPSMSASR